MQAKYMEALAGVRTPMMLAAFGDCFLKQKNPANALVCLDAAIEMNPDSAKSHKIYTKACCALGKWEEALQHAQLALKIDFDDMAYETEKTLSAKLKPIHEVREHATACTAPSLLFLVCV
jgi:tetratricopeptide (TPR) repeat protein